MLETPSRTLPKRSRARRRCRAGQSLAELAVTIPLVGVLIIGAFDTTVMVSDKLAAAYAVRQGARLASELGGAQTNPGATQAAIDAKIVRNVLAVTRGMAYGTIQEIDIYQVTSPTGLLQVGDLVDQFDSHGNPLAGGTQTFTLDKRNQTPPLETSIGVRLIWQYTVPTGDVATFNLMDYAVMKAAPVLD